MVAGIGPVRQHIAVEIPGQGVFVQALEMIGFAKRVGGQFPVHFHVDCLLRSEHVSVPTPAFEVVGQAFEDGVGINYAIWVEVDDQEAVSLCRGQFDQAQAGLVDVAEVVFHRHPDQRTGIVISPGVEPAGKPGPLPALLVLDDGSPVAARIQKSPNLAVGAAGQKDRDTQVVVGKKGPGTWKVATHADDLGVVTKKHLPLMRHVLTAGVDIRRGEPQASGVEIDACVQLRNQFLNDLNLDRMSHRCPRRVTVQYLPGPSLSSA